jgi:hypothetical protein
MRMSLGVILRYSILIMGGIMSTNMCSNFVLMQVYNYNTQCHIHHNIMVLQRGKTGP